MTIGERLKYIRKDVKNMTLEEFGDRLGVKRNTLSTIENNKGNVTDQMRRSVCREFGVNENWLLTGEGEPFLAKTRSEEIADFINAIPIEDNSFKARFITALARMTPEEWLLVEKMVNRIAGFDDGTEVTSVQPSTEQLEEEYRKTLSPAVQKADGSVSNTTEESAG